MAAGITVRPCCNCTKTDIESEANGGATSPALLEPALLEPPCSTEPARFIGLRATVQNTSDVGIEPFMVGLTEGSNITELFAAMRGPMRKSIIGSGDPSEFNAPLQNLFQSYYHLVRRDLGVILDNNIYLSPEIFNDSIIGATETGPQALLTYASSYRAQTSNGTLMAQWRDSFAIFNETDRVPVLQYLRPVPRLKPLGSAITSVFVATFAMVSTVWTAEIVIMIYQTVEMRDRMYGGYITLEAQPFWVIIAAIRALLRGLGAALLWALLRGGRRNFMHIREMYRKVVEKRENRSSIVNSSKTSQVHKAAITTCCRCQPREPVIRAGQPVAYPRTTCQTTSMQARTIIPLIFIKVLVSPVGLPRDHSSFPLGSAHYPGFVTRGDGSAPSPHRARQWSMTIRPRCLVRQALYIHLPPSASSATTVRDLIHIARHVTERRAKTQDIFEKFLGKYTKIPGEAFPDVCWGLGRARPVGGGFLGRICALSLQPGTHLAFLLALDLSSTQLAPGYHSLDSPEATRLVRSAPGPLCVPLDPVWYAPGSRRARPPLAPLVPDRQHRTVPLTHLKRVVVSDCLYGRCAAASLLSRARPPPFPPAPGAASSQWTTAHRAPASYEAFGGLILALRPLRMPLHHFCHAPAPRLSRPLLVPLGPNRLQRIMLLHCTKRFAVWDWLHAHCPNRLQRIMLLHCTKRFAVWDWLHAHCAWRWIIFCHAPAPRLSRPLLVPPAANRLQHIVPPHRTKRLVVSFWLYDRCACRWIIFCSPARPPPFPPAPGAASSQSTAAHHAPALYEAFRRLGLALRSLVWPSRIGSTLTARGAGSSFVHPPAPRLSRPLLVPPAPNPPQRIVPPHLMKRLAVSDWLYDRFACRWIIFCPPAPPTFPPAPGAASS
ncbi:hypothetical protein DFH06DRAFT_1374094 [Mycena polygramma]|nr:hypothetical protein DFH06DRAFT_1374094 [Mycena polygramma]